MKNIDVDRGVTIKKHKSSQSYVLMYKDAPGTYYNAQGYKVPEEMAAEAGFDVKKMAVYRKKNDALKKFHEEAEAQAEADLAAISQGDFKVVAERNGFKLLQLPNAGKQARGKVVDEDNNPMQGVPALPMTEAMKLFQSLAGNAGEESKGVDKKEKES